MKKIMCFLPIMLILCACGHKPAELKTVFKAAAVCRCGKTEIEALVESERNKLKIEIIKPEDAAGCIYSYTAKGFKISLNGLEIGGEESCLPDSAFPSVLYNVLSDAEKNAQLSGKNNYESEYKGECESGKYTLSADYNSGYISNIELNNMNIEFKYD